jgi:hypothetical protein
MEKLRTPFFIGAVSFILLAVLLETGSGLPFRLNEKDQKARLDEAITRVEGLTSKLVASPNLGSPLPSKRLPGVGIPFMAFLDGLILLTVGLMGAQFFIGEQLQGRIQGIVNLAVSALVLVAVITSIFLTIAKVMLMVGLLVAFPFGTLIYLAMWGYFNTTGASVALGLLLTLKLLFGACLVLAHPRFLQNKGLVLITITSLLANVVLSFFHALVPSILVSITDAIAGIVVLVLAAIWAILFLVGSATAVRRAARYLSSS